MALILAECFENRMLGLAAIITAASRTGKSAAGRDVAGRIAVTGA
jgi:hypothetical protein